MGINYCRGLVICPLFYYASFKCGLVKEKEIENKITEVIRKNSFFTVSVHVNPKDKIFIFADSIKSIGIDDCVYLTREIRKQIPEIDNYELQVSSPGANEPFKVYEQYEKNIGRKVSVKIQDGKQIAGTLFECDNEQIKIKPNQKQGKKEANDIVTINFGDIISTKLIISF